MGREGYVGWWIRILQRFSCRQCVSQLWPLPFHLVVSWTRNALVSRVSSKVKSRVINTSGSIGLGGTSWTSSIGNTAQVRIEEGGGDRRRRAGLLRMIGVRPFVRS